MIKQARMNFESDAFECQDYSHDSVITMTTLETFGTNVDEMLDNATIGLVDWHGNERGYIGIGELKQSDYDFAVKLITDFVNEQGLKAITVVAGGQ